MKFLQLRDIVFIIVFQLFVSTLHALEGMQISAHGIGGIGLVSPQNHYDNSFYELDYKYKIGIGGQFNVGYGFTHRVSAILATGFQNYHQQYTGEFSPGLGAPNQSHLKDINLGYLNIGLLAKYATTFQDAYVYGSKAQLVLMGGIMASNLISAKVSYKANGEEVAYPSKLIPYTSEEYPYEPFTKGKDLYTKWALSFVLNIGADVFLSDKIAISPSIQTQISLLDINNKNYRVHETYKASRTIFGGLNLGITYYINRG